MHKKAGSIINIGAKTTFIIEQNNNSSRTSSCNRELFFLILFHINRFVLYSEFERFLVAFEIYIKMLFLYCASSVLY